MPVRQTRIPPAVLERLIRDILAAYAVPDGDAACVARCLVDADLCGVGSHGASRLPIYLDRLRRGLINPAPAIEVRQPFPAAAQIDADNGFGFVAGTRAMAEAVALARTGGIGIAFVRRSNHFGMAATYLRQAAEAGLAALAFSNASPTMPIWGAREPFLGTNPLGFAAPGPAGQAPVVLDMALSVVARGRIRQAAQRQEPIPLGWALDAEGNPTDDARKGYEGTVLPLGGAKGSGLSLMVDILAGLMSGAAFGGAVRNQYTDFDEPQDVGHCFIALRPDLCMPMDEYGERMAELSDRARSLPRAEGSQEILLPGERKARAAEAARRDGLVLDAETAAALGAEARRTQVPLPPSFPT